VDALSCEGEDGGGSCFRVFDFLPLEDPDPPDLMTLDPFGGGIISLSFSWNQKMTSVFTKYSKIEMSHPVFWQTVRRSPFLVHGPLNLCSGI